MRWFGMLFALPLAEGKEYKTIDKLAKAYSSETCKGCHATIHDDGKASYHSQPLVHSLDGIKTSSRSARRKRGNSR